jgi:hypothetical protein
MVVLPIEVAMRQGLPHSAEGRVAEVTVIADE